MGLENAALLIGILAGVVGGMMFIVHALTPNREADRISRQSDEVSRVAMAKHIVRGGRPQR